MAKNYIISDVLLNILKKYDQKYIDILTQIYFQLPRPIFTHIIYICSVIFLYLNLKMSKMYLKND